MDASVIAVVRAANVARNGDNHKKEALGLQLISRAIEQDGRLVCLKSFEGARADFCVYPKDKPGAPALGVQLKTTGVNMVQRQTVQFGATDGYVGLLMVFMALHVEPRRIWLADGSRVVSKSIAIPVDFPKGVRSDRLKEVDLATVAGAIYTIYLEAMSGSSNYVLRSPEDHEKPNEGSRLGST